MKNSLIALALTCIAPAALADTPVNLVTNGSFELGTSGWSVRPEGIEDGFVVEADRLDFDGSTPLTAAHGTHWARLLCIGYGECGVGHWSGTTIDQNLSTVAGASYNLSFALGAGIWGGTGVDVYWNGTKVAENIEGASGWKQFSVSGLKGTGNDTLSFGTNADGYAYAYLDNVKVTAAVPEPETYALFIAGLSLMTAMTRRRKS